MIKYEAVLLIGPTGSGKGTQAKKLEELGNYVHISMGDTKRELYTQSPELIREYDFFRSKRDHLNASLTFVKMLDHAIEQLKIHRGYDPNAHRLVIDGIPRYEAQISPIDERLEIYRVFHFDAPNQISYERVATRSQNGQRPKDLNVEVTRAKLARFKKSTLPVIREYESRNLLTTLDASKPIDEVHVAILVALGHRS